MENHFLNRAGMILSLHGVVFLGADARDVQKYIALQNNVVNTKSLEKLTKTIENSGQRIFRELINEMLGII